MLSSVLVIRSHAETVETSCSRLQVRASTLLLAGLLFAFAQNRFRLSPHSPDSPHIRGRPPAYPAYHASLPNAILPALSPTPSQTLALQNSRTLELAPPTSALSPLFNSQASYTKPLSCSMWVSNVFHTHPVLFDLLAFHVPERYPDAPFSINCHPQMTTAPSR